MGSSIDPLSPLHGMTHLLTLLPLCMSVMAVLFAWRLGKRFEAQRDAASEGSPEFFDAVVGIDYCVKLILWSLFLGIGLSGLLEVFG